MRAPFRTLSDGGWGILCPPLSQLLLHVET